MRYYDSLERLIEVVQQLSLARSLDDISAIVRVAARQITAADAAVFVLRDGDQCYYADESGIAPLWKGRRFPLAESVAGWAILNRRPAVVGDVATDPRAPDAKYAGTFARSALVVPIRVLDPVGAIGAFWAVARTPQPWEVRVLQALADTTSVAIENVRVLAELETRVQARTAELEAANRRLAAEVAERRRAEEEVRRLSLTDELTGVYNRRGFYTVAGQEWKAARRMRTRCALLFADLDGLKRANDAHGHEVGDALIAAAGRVLRDTLREADVVARMGGDEFAVFALDCPAELRALADRVRDAVDEFNEYSPLPVPLAMSMGVFPLDPADDRPLDELVAEADHLMYSAKRERKRLSIGHDEPPSGVIALEGTVRG